LYELTEQMYILVEQDRNIYRQIIYILIKQNIHPTRTNYTYSSNKMLLSGNKYLQCLNKLVQRAIKYVRKSRHTK
jgi:hypothetical protein